MLKVGDKVEWVKPSPNYRNWYGTVAELGEHKVKIEWIIREGKTKFKWEPYKDVKWIDVIPVNLPQNKRRSRDFLQDIDYPAPYRDWHMDGNCYANGEKLFVGYSTLRPNAKTRAKLEEACRDCRVMIICRSEALKTDSVGWWGGMDEADRLQWAKTLPLKEMAE